MNFHGGHLHPAGYYSWITYDTIQSDVPILHPLFYGMYTFTRITSEYSNIRLLSSDCMLNDMVVMMIMQWCFCCRCRDCIILEVCWCVYWWLYWHDIHVEAIRIQLLKHWKITYSQMMMIVLLFCCTSIKVSIMNWVTFNRDDNVVVVLSWCCVYSYVLTYALDNVVVNDVCYNCDVVVIDMVMLSIFTLRVGVDAFNNNIITQQSTTVDHQLIIFNNLQQHIWW